MWIPAFAGMTNRSYRIQVNSNPIAFLQFTTKIPEISDSLEVIYDGV